jgi:hypothetical protein
MRGAEGGRLTCANLWKAGEEVIVSKESSCRQMMVGLYNSRELMIRSSRLFHMVASRVEE